MTVENDRVSRYNSVVIAQRLGQTFNLGSLVFSQNKQTNKQKKRKWKSYRNDVWRGTKGDRP